MIIFRNLKWKNLLSTGNYYTEVNLYNASNTLVVGENGSGKSTMLDALCFALFGKPFRSINKPQLVNSINNKDCVVEVTFDANNKNYRVVRGIKPNLFEIYCNGDLVNQIYYSIDPELVSSDIIGNTCCSVYDSSATIISKNGKNIVLYTWYDNEFGYTKQVIRLAKYISKVRRAIYY